MRSILLVILFLPLHIEAAESDDCYVTEGGNISIVINDIDKREEIITTINDALSQSRFEIGETENQYVRPDLGQICFFEWWYGLEPSHLLFVQHKRDVPVQNRWQVISLVDTVASYLADNELSQFVHVHLTNSTDVDLWRHYIHYYQLSQVAPSISSQQSVSTHSLKVPDEELAFTAGNCIPNQVRNISIKVLEQDRIDDVMGSLYETMERHGFAPLPENAIVPSDNKFVLPDDDYTCYFEWYGLGSNHVMFVRNYRYLPMTYRVLGKPAIWDVDLFYQAVKNTLIDDELFDSIELSVRDIHYHSTPQFEQEMWRKSGPQHAFEWYENGSPARDNNISSLRNN